MLAQESAGTAKINTMTASDIRRTSSLKSLKIVPIYVPMSETILFLLGLTIATIIKVVFAA